MSNDQITRSAYERWREHRRVKRQHALEHEYFVREQARQNGLARRVLRLAIGGGVAVTLALPVAVQASTITFNGDVMTIEGTEGVNSFSQLFSSNVCPSRPPGACLTISSFPMDGSSDPLTFPADRCSAFGSFVQCDMPTKVIANLRGGDDAFTTGVIPGLVAELHGGAGADTLYGGSSDDEIYGDSGNDYLGGNAGDDLLDGGEGDDALDGSLTDATRTAGSDLYVGGPGSQDYVSYLSLIHI